MKFVRLTRNEINDTGGMRQQRLRFVELFMIFCNIVHLSLSGIGDAKPGQQTEIKIRPNT